MSADLPSDYDALARLAVTLPAWEWRPGMVTDCGHVVLLGNRSYDSLTGRADDIEPEQGDIPDLSDPATLGALLGLVREVYGDPAICVIGETVGMWVALDDYGDELTPEQPSEAHALIAALAALPQETP